MKKIILIMSILFLGVVVLYSCSNDHPNQDEQKSVLEEKYMSIENAEYRDGNFPTATMGSTISGISLNENALQGGMNFITVVTEDVYKNFFIGVKGIPGYWVYDPKEESTRNSGEINTYVIPVMYSPELDTNVTMLIGGEYEDGEVTEPYEAEITFVDSKTGLLDVKLIFSNDKDIDLHLYMPNGQHIYYGERGGSAETVDGDIVSYGLDHDSNAGCNIDGFRNENIYVPEALLQSGTYRVAVDMFRNCDPSISTSWSIVVRYKGELITPISGRNPASGVYPVGAADGDMTTVMEFTLSDVNSTRNSTLSKIKPNSFIPTPLSDMDEMKLERLMFDKD